MNLKGHKMNSMTKIVLLLGVTFLSACVSVSSQDARMTNSFSGRTPLDKSRYQAPRALDRYVDKLMAEGRDWQQHGIYIETLRDGEPIAILNETGEFNPASVMKLATSLAALDKLGSDYRFRTEFRTDGSITAGELVGDLILLSGGDPAFSIADAKRVGDALRQIGIRRVNGRLMVVGDFTCNENSSSSVSANVLIRNSGVVFRYPPQFETFAAYRPRGNSLMTVESDTLLNIVQYLNAHSVNSMAEMLAMHIGGPEGVERFLIEEIGMPRGSVYISRASGLEVNRLTPRDTVKMLRAMMEWLDQHRLAPSSVMAVAGRDAGTLRGRFTESKFAGSIIAKTGTLYSTDSGVAALAGIMYTRNYGPMLFAIYDMAEGRRVPHLRQIQDEFLKQLMEECGGPAPVFGKNQRAGGGQMQSRMLLAQGN